MKWEILNKLNDKSLVDVLLENRGIKTKKEKGLFLSPAHPRELSFSEAGISRKEVQKAINRIARSMKEKEKIVVYGDYDVDGVCAAAIMWETLYALGADAIPFIPDRFEDGYGLNKSQISKLKSQNENLKLIITVDNGIVAFEAVAEANKLGIDVVITDHHEKKQKLPDACAVVHTIQTSGAGVSWFLAKEINRKISKKARTNKLELAAMGVIADQLPLLGINRSIVKFGMEDLNKTTRPGLRKLFVVSGILDKRIGTYEVNFAIAPRINASGRMGSAMDSLRLLCTTSPERAQKLAMDLNNLNIDRQKKVEESLLLVEKSLIDKTGIIFLHADFHEGIIGLIASRIVEKYYRPAIVFSVSKAVSKASARSVSGFNITDAMRFGEEFILEGGGHEMAAGFSIKTVNIKKFKEKLSLHSEKFLTKDVLERKIKIDCELLFSQINKEMHNELSAFEPFGVGNPTPQFISKDVNVISLKSLGKDGRHKKLVLEQNNKKMNAIFFNCEKEIKGKVSVLYKLGLNEWNGKSDIELMVRDIKNE